MVHTHVYRYPSSFVHIPGYSLLFCTGCEESWISDESWLTFMLIKSMSRKWAALGGGARQPTLTWQGADRAHASQTEARLRLVR